AGCELFFSILGTIHTPTMGTMGWNMIPPKETGLLGNRGVTPSWPTAARREPPGAALDYAGLRWGSLVMGYRRVGEVSDGLQLRTIRNWYTCMACITRPITTRMAERPSATLDASNVPQCCQRVTASNDGVLAVPHPYPQSKLCLIL